jgi:hypothetical protein
MSNRKVPQPGRSLGDRRPDLVSEWHRQKNGSLTPFDVTYGSARKVWWQCPVAEDHEYEATANNRTSGKNCPCCKGCKTVPSNCLAVLNPTAAERWDQDNNGDLTPWDVTPQSNRKAFWKCPVADDHRWEAIIYAVTRFEVGGCPFCRGFRIAASNCLATLDPRLSSEWHPTKNGSLTPYDVPRSAYRKVWWKCNQVTKHEWYASLDHRTRGSGCPHCDASKGEARIADILDGLGVIYQRQLPIRSGRRGGPMKFDFSVIVAGKRAIIEFHGVQHYRPIGHFGGAEAFRSGQERDQVKRDFCRSHGLPCLEIPHWDFDRIEELVLDFINTIQKR